MRYLTTLIAGILAISILAGGVRAEEGFARRTLGWGHVFNNDYIGDGGDRWQTGSYFLSVLRGPRWTGDLPERPFSVMEYRFGASIIAPSDLVTPAAIDRRYVGRLHFGANTYWQAHGAELRLGLGAVTIGPDTGVSDLHGTFHRWISAPQPLVAANELGNRIIPVISGEAAREYRLGATTIRPFVAARAGDEEILRAGVDLSFGPHEGGALWLRDEITGQRYVGISGQDIAPPWAFTLGADAARVFGSDYFPSADGVAYEETRYRARAGVNMRFGGVGLFYGVTWLSEEFAGQPEGQVLGSLRLRMNF